MQTTLDSVSGELFTAFNAVEYHDEPHKYYVGEKGLISVTGLLHEYVEEFEEDYWSEIKAKEYNLTTKEIVRAWKFINEKGTIKGSAIHDYTENLFLNKVFEYPKEKILNKFGFDPIWIEYQMTKKHVNAFYEATRGKLIPIKTEFVVYDKKTFIGGMIDMLFYNIKAKEFQLWDWKTNKDFTKKTNRRLKYQLYLLDDSDITIYSLQLELYKQIIERNTSIRLGKSYIVWFSHNNSNYEVIETIDMKNYVNQIFTERENMLAP